jgi:hypothetical protein
MIVNGLLHGAGSGGMAHNDAIAACLREDLGFSTWSASRGFVWTAKHSADPHLEWVSVDDEKISSYGEMEDVYELGCSPSLRTAAAAGAVLHGNCSSEERTRI